MDGKCTRSLNGDRKEYEQIMNEQRTTNEWKWNVMGHSVERTGNGKFISAYTVYVVIIVNEAFS